MSYKCNWNRFLVRQGSSGNLEVFIKWLKIETCLSKRAVEIGKAAKTQEPFPALHLNDNVAVLRGIDKQTKKTTIRKA
jgi:hypothetical protein